MYDSTTANPVNPQGTAGGGNNFNVAPLFGEGSFFLGGRVSGSGAASTTSTDTAAATGGTAVPTVGPSTTGAPSASASWTPLVTLAVFGVAIFALAAAAVKLFNKKS